MKIARLLGCAVLLLMSTGAYAASTKAVVAKVKPYRVSPSLKEVSNLRSYEKTFPLAARTKSLLAKNLFAVTPTDAPQLFHIYEQNDYENIPSFVSTDIVLQVYHIFFDYTLRTTETEKLLPALKSLTSGMLAQSLHTYRKAHDPNVKAAALRNIAYFDVAARGLGMTVAVPRDAAVLAKAENALIDAHAGKQQSAIFPYEVDYSQFIPRGHYTRSEALKKYFRTMMWYGLIPVSLKTDDSDKPGSLRVIRQALLIAHDLYAARLFDKWQTIYEPTAFYVGASDDLTPAEVHDAAASVFGADATVDSYGDVDKLAAFCRAAANARAPRIKTSMRGVPGGIQFRFMGQRYIADSEILQKLSTPVDRVFPSGLDVMAVLGSRRAASILDQYASIYNAKPWPDYVSERNKLTAQFAEIPENEWSSNLYWSWLDCLRTLNRPVGSGYPSFMRTSAWRDKSLDTTLASWAELRHDTILYGKQSVTECGGGGEPPPPVYGYVEPNVAFYNRLLALTEQSRSGLKKRGLITDDVDEKFGDIEDLLHTLLTISAKELRNENLTDSENDEIRYIGGQFEHLTLSVMEGEPSSWDLVDETDQDMAVVADVHAGGDKALEEAVGHANEILVIVRVRGKLELTRGAVFSYYEFKQPVSDRLTDEKWQGLIKHGQAPKPPVWTKTFLAPGGKKLNPGQFQAYSSGC